MIKWLKDVVNEITIEDLPEPYKAVAGVAGVEAAVSLSQDFAGVNLYFPQLDKFLVKRRDALIRKEFNGTNYNTLAVKYGLSARWVRNIVDHKKSQEK